jgi:monoamine oxidase
VAPRLEADIAVLGAGMAGVTAGRALEHEGLGVVVLEAGQRVGGRVCTVRDFAPYPVEAGAEFIHGADAATWADVRAAGLRTIVVPQRRSWLHLAGTTRWLPLHLASPDAWHSVAILRAVRRLDEDLSAAEFVAGKGYRRRAEELAGLTLAAHLPGGLEEIGVGGLVADGVLALELGRNHRVLDGYDGLPGHVARGLDIRFGWRAEKVSWSTDGVEITSADGRTLAARAAVTTLPHGVLGSGAVTFDPALPEDKAHAIATIRTGAVVKVLLRFDERFWPARMAQVACGTGPMTLYWPASYGTDRGPALVGYATGPRARALSEAGADTAFDVATDDLMRLFPRARPDRLLVDARFVDWPNDPLARGGYTFLPPGAVGARAALAAPTTGALFWAGSATAWSPVADTVEAAYLSGLRAAREAGAALDGRGPPVSSSGRPARPRRRLPR